MILYGNIKTVNITLNLSIVTIQVPWPPGKTAWDRWCGWRSASGEGRWWEDGPSVDTPGSPSPAGGANTCDHPHHDPGTQGTTGTESTPATGESLGEYTARGLFTGILILVDGRLVVVIIYSTVTIKKFNIILVNKMYPSSWAVWKDYSSITGWLSLKSISSTSVVRRKKVNKLLVVD